MSPSGRSRRDDDEGGIAERRTRRPAKSNPFNTFIMMVFILGLGIIIVLVALGIA